MILDGPLGTELLRRGVPTPLPLWSAWALRNDPDAIAAIHRDYALAGATVHTTNTFRTKRRQLGDAWADLARAAVRVARNAVPDDHTIAGSIAPLEDCYRPDLSPERPRAEHRELALLLAEEGCDLLLCETFPHIGEALVAIDEAVATGLPTWASFTAGPETDLLTPDQIHTAALQARERGAVAVLINCIPASRTLEYLHAVDVGLPFGAYANAGHADEKMGWEPSEQAPELYADLAQTWVDAGATLLGGCCGTDPRHIAELSRRFGPTRSR
ncbi:MAG: homocysteine S-methyltransferase family protein [Proteobacteria bacterium]|nr:homocysteine S-methyltransferase family protein [Pseudomonadota bacterium]